MTLEITKLINITNYLFKTGRVESGTSVEERIAATFIIGDMDYLPGGYRNIGEAWNLLGPELQERVKTIKEEHGHLIEAE